MTEEILIITDIIATLVSVAAIIIIIWDKIKGSANLRKQVQTYYYGIERLIFHYFERAYYGDIVKHDAKTDMIFKRHHSKWVYYENYIRNNFTEFGKWLGLVLSGISYLNKSNIALDVTGSYKTNLKHYKEGYKITREEVDFIDKFLDYCVNHWNVHHASLVKRKIKRKIDYKILMGFKEPYTPNKRD